VRYDVLPDRLVNPWIAYGFGLESTGVSATTNGVSSSTTYAGWDWARFMVGTDFRTSSVVGLGPYVEFSLGQYSKVGTSAGGHDTSSDVASSALHEWLSFGIRGTLFP
jgi:hypothetical protein